MSAADRPHGAAGSDSQPSLTPAKIRDWHRQRKALVHSRQSTQGRPGFQYLLAEVGLDHVGIILGLEMSRLARSNKDRHQLLELCALFGTLLADPDGVYDPRD